MRARSFVLALAMLLPCGFAHASPAAGPLRVAAFRADVTPPLGEPLIWVTPATKVEDPLWAKGIVLEGEGGRYVLCSLDWCGIGGSAHTLFRKKLAAAAGTDISRVTVHSVHQHTAPYIEGGGRDLLISMQAPVRLMTDRALSEVTDRIAQAVRLAVDDLQPFDSVGVGQAPVERVASARRIMTGGKLTTRFSGSGSNPEMAALPEGPVDTALRVITLARGRTPLVRLSFYASHPQTFCCDGRVTADMVGMARDAMERAENVPHIYFTGCAGDVTVGKYNDGSAEARQAMADRLRDGMKAAIAATEFGPAQGIQWSTRVLKLPAKSAPDAEKALRDPQREEAERYRAAITVAFSKNAPPLQVGLIRIGRAAALFLPGEPMLEFQQYALSLRGARFLAVAGYGDISPGYLCTDRAFREGGYEPSASNSGPGTEARLKGVIYSLLTR